MINSSLWEYFLIRIFIFFCRFTPLLHASLLLLRTYQLGWPAAWSSLLFRIAAVQLFLEAVFAATLYRTYARAERRALFDKCFHHVSNFDDYLKLWFLGADVSELRRDNIREFLLWGFFDQDLKMCDEDSVLDELEEYIVRVEERLGRKLEPGKSSARCLRLTLDDVQCRYRSLTWYGIVFLVDLVSHATLHSQGFSFYAQSLRKGLRVFPPRVGHLIHTGRTVASDLSYWYRPHRAPGKLPIVFLHGIGIGLWTYAKFLSELNSGAADDQIGIVAIEILPISFRLTFDEPLGAPEFTRQVTKILANHGIEEFVLVAHSYGSVVTTQMLRSKELAPRIASVVLVDPVNLLLHEPYVAFNFTRRKPKTAAQWQLWYFASMDPGVAYVLGRHFFWRESIVWKEDLFERKGIGGDADKKVRRRVAVFLAERDLIVCTPAVLKYLRDEELIIRSPDDGDIAEPGRIDVTSFPNLDHAQVFDSPTDREKVLSVIRSYAAFSG
ncbi:hypothetical protein jhhlp_004529 [Lomentospora prolificans]|uniref:AB hydrolase-1 domain-containing protein n=1 Tax=Lomentospora prolificans TaxID=41688 RepID=A0A2N3NBS4_9PEZI|nr:hypothetical protein jhhlp_004529 [Lomentospora prolificans]